MARPFVASLLESCRAGTVVMLAHPRVAPLWRAWPGLQVLETRPGPWLTDAWSTSRRLRTLGPFRQGFLLSASFRSAATLALAGVSQRTGFAASGRSFLLTQPVPRRPAGNLHYGQEFFHLYPSGRSKPVVPDFQWPARARAGATQIQTAHGIAGAAYAAIAVGSAGHAKRYPVGAWRDVISQISLQHPVVLVGTATEGSLAAEASAGLEDRVFNLCGSTGLAELALILSDAAGFAGADSGAAHLAAAVGCPAVVLFGPGDPVETAPTGEGVRILRDGLWCSPCRSRVCLRPDAPSECMDRIPPKWVSTTLLAALRA